MKFKARLSTGFTAWQSENTSSPIQIRPQTILSIYNSGCRRVPNRVHSETSGLSERDKFGMAEETAFGRLGEFYFCLDFRMQPNVVTHFFGSDTFAPVA